MAVTTIVILVMCTFSGCIALRRIHTDFNVKAKKVAYVVFVTDMKDATMKDVLAVSAYSLKRAASKSHHDVDLLVLAPERFPEEDANFLQQKGFTVIKKPLPVDLSEIDPEVGKEVIKQWGRTQGQGKNIEFPMAEETLKYWPLSMMGYERVLMLDADVLVLDPMDELIEREEDFIGTYDHGLDIADSIVPPVQGGFLFYRPNLEDFEEIKRLTRMGDFHGAGWFNSKIGYAYGGTGPDGLLAYYFHKDAIELLKVKGKSNIVDGPYGTPTKGVRMFAADRSKYDVVINDRLRQDLAHLSEQRIINDLKSIHFTGDCIKPWQCAGKSNRYLSGVCDAMTARWFEMRAEVQKELGQTPDTKPCVNGQYKPIH